MNKNESRIVAVALTLLTASALITLSILYFKEYGWTVFCFIPMLIGFLPPYMAGSKYPMTSKESIKLSFITLLIALAALLFFAFEGMICIAMVLPLVVPIVWLFSYLAYRINDRRIFKVKDFFKVLPILATLSMSFDYYSDSKELIPVKTSVIIDAPIQSVWDQVIHFDTIRQPLDWYLKTGIAYPIDAHIVGTGKGAVRYCNFSTGSFVEPITTWQEPNLLQFSVKEQPIPMNEWNPFCDIHPPHLDGYFQSKKGQFALEKISDNRTKLEGTTWYEVDIAPGGYWQGWCNFLIHKIHMRVLEHIKKEAEQNEKILSSGAQNI